MISPNCLLMDADSAVEKVTLPRHQRKADLQPGLSTLHVVLSA
jgi:hypothetical protein